MVAAAMIGFVVGLATRIGWAHEGVYRGPLDLVPPGIREPFDPVRPPPPPAAGLPTTPAPVTPTTPQPIRPTVPAPMTPARSRTASWSFERWEFWYHHNKDALEAALSRRATLPDKVVTDVVVPALLPALDRAAEPAGPCISAAAHIALAKVTRDIRHVAILERGLKRQGPSETVVRAASALALGLLRRSRVEDQFPPEVLDGVRETLFIAVDNADLSFRTRGFAALGLGLLGDQPTHLLDGESDPLAAERRTTGRLVEALLRHHDRSDLPIALLLAIGLQPAASIAPAHLDLLRTCVRQGKLGAHEVSGIVQAHAVPVLARLGAAEDVELLRRLLGSRRIKEQNVSRSAAIGLRILGNRFEGSVAERAAEALLVCVAKQKDASTIQYASMGLASLLGAVPPEQAAGSTIWRHVGELLLDTARRGGYSEQPYATVGLALALRARAGEPDVATAAPFRTRALAILRDGMSSRKLESSARAACATALGLVGDSADTAVLMRTLADNRADRHLRTYAALALGIEGVEGARGGLIEAASDRHDNDLRRQAVASLGLLGTPFPAERAPTIAALLDALEYSKEGTLVATCVEALSRAGGEDVARRFAEMLGATRQSPYERAIVCAGLGLLGDREVVPSRALLLRDANYRATTDVLSALWALL